MIYTSTDNKKIKELKKLNIKKYRDQSNSFLVEGEHLVLEAYKKGLLEELFLEENTKLDLDVKTSYLSRNVIKFISELDNPSNIIGLCKKVEEKEIGNKVLVLDDIQDPGNFGTIIRSAVAFNIDTIVVSNNTVDLYNSKVIRASQGMLFNINIIRRDLNVFVPELKKEGYQIYATKVNGGKSLKTIEKMEKFAIIMGNEGAGVSDNLMSLANEYLYIDMNSNCESLNVAVATSIILYELDK
jgi:TrmH family RNA methyltransferase